jgi:hypothetical protein
MIGLLPYQFGRYLLLLRIVLGDMAELFRGTIAGVEHFQEIVAIKRLSCPSL